MPHIHPTAVIEPGAELASDVVVGPYCVIGPKVRIGAGTILHNHVTITGKTTVGQGNVIFAQSILGSIPQDLKFKGEDSELIIGDHNVIREMVTMHIGTANAGGVTRVGNHNLIMVSCHVAHDCHLGDHIIMANGVCLAGHVVVEDHASIGGIVGVHHFVTFGRHCFVGGMSRIIHDVPPFMICEGNPNKVRGLNSIGLQRAGMPEETINHLKKAYRLLYQDTSAGNAFSQRVDQLEMLFPHDVQITELATGIRNSLRGTYGRYRETLRQDPRRFQNQSPDRLAAQHKA